MVMRGIVQEREVTQDIEAAKKSFRLVDEAICGIEWTLSRDPQAGTHRSGLFWVYAQNGFKVHRIPEIVVLYSFTDDQVTLHAIVFRNAD
jgi:predicted membrane-bound dolichyl-phosphate-mannose-protein mannosyltransferase